MHQTKNISEDNVKDLSSDLQVCFPFIDVGCFAVNL